MTRSRKWLALSAKVKMPPKSLWVSSQTPRSWWTKRWTREWWVRDSPQLGLFHSLGEDVGYWGIRGGSHCDPWYKQSLRHWDREQISLCNMVTGSFSYSFSFFLTVVHDQSRNLEIAILVTAVAHIYASSWSCLSCEGTSNSLNLQKNQLNQASAVGVLSL